ncbi:hypothetical protein AT261_23625 [Bacillus cereus]|uniref:hypothetical protein n=1 Tax=unclassified Bacillus (in: firmicutes) TaxID=185979 RepID=UPI00077ADC08|nr:hypothetical protein AT261_23625 [Bacillus cereus]
MTNSVVNKAGAKIYSDINKHEMLELPVLVNNKSNGIIHEVLSVGLQGAQREPIVTIKKSNQEAIAYRLPKDLQGWVENAMFLTMQGMNPFPSRVEFGILDNRAFVEIL